MLNSLAYENAKTATQAAGFATATDSKGCYCLMILPDNDWVQQVSKYRIYSLIRRTRL